MSFDELKTILEKSKVDMKDISVFRSVAQFYDEITKLQNEINTINARTDEEIGGLYGA